MSRQSLVPVLFAIILILFLSTSGHAYRTKSVFIVVVDGIRDHEAFAYEFQPNDTLHPYIPFIWNTLMPQGTAFMEMYNEVFTFTSPAHQTILTGDWNIMPNLQAEELRYQTHPWIPTIFEYARRDLNVPRSKVWCVVGKLNCTESNWSLHPTYGEELGASLIHYPEEPVPETDSLTVDALMGVLDLYSPSLVLVNLQGVDVAGHTGIWEEYIDAIRLADRAVQRIWDRITMDPFYRDKTTLIVTTDHGRHDDGLGGPLKPGFQSHGGICHGCRHVMFLAVGPDTPDSVEIMRRAWPIDIAPTIGELLGFNTPFSRGQVLGELITGYDKPVRRIRKEPAVDMHDGKVFICWSDNRTGNDEVYFIASMDSGRTFGDTLQLSDSRVRAIQPDVAAGDSIVHVTWLDYRAERWEIYYRRSSDFGLTWEDERLLFSSIEEDEFRARALELWEPRLEVDGERCLISIAGHRDFVSALLSEDGGDTWMTDIIDSNSYYATNVTGSIFGNRISAVWSVQSWLGTPLQNWDIQFVRGSFPGGNWNVYRRLSDDSPYSIQPAIASNDLLDVGVAWADNRYDIFRILFRESRDGGLFWYPQVQVSDSPKGGWQPVLEWDRSTGNLHLIWTDYRDLGGEIYHRFYDGLSWSAPERLTRVEGSVDHPDMAFDGAGNSYFVWETVANDEVSIGMGDLLSR